MNNNYLVYILLTLLAAFGTPTDGILSREAAGRARAGTLVSSKIHGTSKGRRYMSRPIDAGNEHLSLCSNLPCSGCWLWGNIRVADELCQQNLASSETKMLWAHLLDAKSPDIGIHIFNSLFVSSLSARPRPQGSRPAGQSRRLQCMHNECKEYPELQGVPAGHVQHVSIRYRFQCWGSYISFHNTVYICSTVFFLCQQEFLLRWCGRGFAFQKSRSPECLSAVSLSVVVGWNTSQYSWLLFSFC